MRKYVWLAMAVFAANAPANHQLDCTIENFGGTNDYVDVEIAYPAKGQTLYQVRVVGWDNATRKEIVFGEYDGVGKLDRRMIDGKLTLFHTGTQDAAGKMWFVEPEEQEFDPKTGQVIGRERKMQIGSPTPMELDSCYLNRFGST